MLRFDWKSTVAKCHQLVHPAAINPREMLGKDFVLLNENIKRMLGSNHPVLNTISNYYFNKQGKNIRPLIVLLMSQATLFSRISNFVDIDSPTVGTSPIQFEKSTPSSTNVLPTQRRLAEITEMIHTASLLHDDVIDASLQRRNFPTVNAEFGNKMAILAGDFLLARASVALSRLRNTQVTELIATVISNLVEGEFMQLRNSGSSKLLNVNDAFWKNESGLDISRFSYYMEKTYLKTASLIAKSSHAAALLGGSDNVIGNAAYTYGKCLGISFQVLCFLFSLLMICSTLLYLKNSLVNP
jgi:hexaprenyl-diphosphate synthase